MMRFLRPCLVAGLLLAAPTVATGQALVVVDPAGPVRTLTEALTRVSETPGLADRLRVPLYAGGSPGQT